VEIIADKNYKCMTDTDTERLWSELHSKWHSQWWSAVVWYEQFGGTWTSTLGRQQHASTASFRLALPTHHTNHSHLNYLW